MLHPSNVSEAIQVMVGDKSHTTDFIGSSRLGPHNFWPPIFLAKNYLDQNRLSCVVAMVFLQTDFKVSHR